jgi:hypothetical protein
MVLAQFQIFLKSLMLENYLIFEKIVFCTKNSPNRLKTLSKCFDKTLAGNVGTKKMVLAQFQIFLKSPMLENYLIFEKMSVLPKVF